MSRGSKLYVALAEFGPGAIASMASRLSSATTRDPR